MSRLRRCARALSVTVGVLLAVVAAMAVQSARAPGAASAEVRFAEWGRNHGLRAEVTWLEHVRSERNSPAALLRPHPSR